MKKLKNEKTSKFPVIVSVVSSSAALISVIAAISQRIMYSRYNKQLIKDILDKMDEAYDEMMNNFNDEKNKKDIERERKVEEIVRQSKLSEKELMELLREQDIPDDSDEYEVL